jgi:hypothetical protein
MEKQNRVRQIYGYTVCLIAVVTSLICVSGAVNNAIDLTNPLMAAGGFDDSLGSFDAWMAARQKLPAPAGNATAGDTASDRTLHIRFDAMKANRIARQNFRAWKGLIGQGLLLIIAVVLFATHWRWMRRLQGDEHQDARSA